MSETVILPINIEPIFPESCVVCLEKDDAELIEFKGELSGSGGYFRLLSGNRGMRLIRAHAECAQKLKRRSFWRNLGIIVFVILILVTWIVMAANGIPLPLELTKTNLCIGVAILVLPILIIEELRPAAFEFREGRNIVTYEFRDTMYAHDFAELNSTKVGLSAEAIEELGKDLSSIGRKLR